MDLPAAVQLLMLLVTMIIAIASWRSANASRRSAQAAAKTVEAQLLSQFLEEYASEEMRRALDALRQFEKNNPDSLPPEVIQTRPGLVKLADSDHRRKLHYYFKRAYILYERGLLSRQSLEIITDANGYRLLFDVVKPLSLAVNPPGSDLSRFDWFDKLREIRKPPTV